ELAIRLAKEGYQIEPPESGKALIETIMAKKAISEFRWTTAQEIVHKGGALARVCLDDYLSWFEKFPESVRQRLTETWGEPPGRETDGVPAAMVYEESIIVTGVPLGPGAVVMLQPKRGCAGSRCDGRVCKILHDPVIPPPHQFLATYKWIADNERGFGAHAIIHVGTHGCLEYLPGKSIGLSEECLPDLAMGDLPHLYLYNCAVTADGLIAKRRSYASIVDHLQPPMVKAGLSGELEELFSLIGQWEGVRPESERAKTIRELVVEKLSLSPLKRDLPDLEGDFAQVARALKGALRLAETSLVEDGLHVLGRVPEGKRLSSAVKGIVRFDSGDKPSLRSLIAGSLGLDLGELLREELSQDPLSGPGREGAVASKAAALIDSAADSLVDALLEGESLSKALPEAISSLGPLSKLSEGREPPAQAEMDRLEARVKALKSRLEGSRELEGLSNGLNGGFITPGPSGFLTRGLDNVAPTGRNFYARDPRRVPTPAAVKVGWALAEAAVARHLKESGKPPRSVSFFWTSADLLQADGEVLAQMLALMGLRPRWDAAGLVSGVEAVTLSDLGRPRIDITCRMSGIVRDLFRPSYEYLDRAVKLAAGLDEPPECNLVRARTLEALAEERGSGRSETDSWRRATSRIFSQRPGSFEGGTYLAVMASAWETEADLAEIFLHHNSCAYGEDVYGLEAQDLLENQLRSVDVNFLSLMGDSQDFLGCGGFFGAQGGLAQAASLIQGRKIRNWCADSRESLAPQVRTISEEINRCLAARLLNPSWLKSMAGHGYKGAAEISRRVTNAYGWLATTGEVDDRALDRLVAAFFEDPELHGFLTENNPWALEEIGRRLLEANSRGLWKADPEA
ncbi:MAG: cobaltochelatase subunit CobN, partial [Deltaproteobacteria bacterium]|nr:cobaltochelatase subunit CobN [Deltaproteobacteria bacterium]